MREAGIPPSKEKKKNQIKNLLHGEELAIRGAAESSTCFGVLNPERN